MSKKYPPVLDEAAGKHARALALATQTIDAYSSSRYASWRAVAAMLLRRGYTEREAEAILRSKWTRWAADASGKDYPTAADLGRFLDAAQRHPQEQTGHPSIKAAVADLVRGTF